MNIMTFVKHVPTQAVTPRIAASRERIEEEGLSYEVNEADLYAIEEALEQRSLHPGSVVAVTIGPGRARDALSIAYARGVNHGIHVLEETFRGTSSILNVQAAARIVKRQGPDLVLSGVQAEDDLQGAFGIALAEVLDLPVVTAVTGISIDPAARVATVVRELGAGMKEEIEVDLPCVITVQFGIRQLRYVSIMSIFRMRSRPVETVSIADLGLPQEAMMQDGQIRVAELGYPEDGGSCEFIGGTADEAVRRLMSRLVEAGAL